MGAEFYSEDFQGADAAPFVGFNTFLHLPLIKNHKELLQAKPDVAIICPLTELSLTKLDLDGGDPVIPNDYPGTRSMCNFGSPTSTVPEKS